MSNTLFRDEVIKARQTDWLGEVRFDAPKFAWPFFFAGLVTTAVILVTLYVGHYTRHERVSGTLRAEQGILDVSAQQPGIITRVLVREGQQVAAGQPLVEISGDLDSVKLGATRALIYHDLQLKREKLQLDLAEQDATLSIRRRELERQINLTTQQIDSIAAQVTIQKEHIGVLSALYEKWASLKDTGVVSKVQLAQSRSDLLQQRSVLEELQRSQLTLFQQKSVFQDQLLRAPLEATTQKNEIAREIADVSNAMSENELLRKTVLMAQKSGVATNVLAYSGEQVVAGRQLLTIIPKNTKLVAELWVPTRAIGFIEIGSDVTMRYRAYPYQKFGVYSGRVSEISRSGLPLDKDPKNPVATDLQEIYYRVVVKLDEQNVTVYGKQEQLKPGMRLDADVAIERRRLLEWIFEPLYGLARKEHPSAKMLERLHDS